MSSWAHNPETCDDPTCRQHWKKTKTDVYIYCPVHVEPLIKVSLSEYALNSHETVYTGLCPHCSASIATVVHKS